MRITAEKAGKRSIHVLAGIAVMLYVLLFGGNTIVSHAGDVRTITDAKVRSQADTGSEQVGSAPQGTTLTVEDETQGTDNNTWYQVTVNGKTGFIRSDLTESVDGGSESSGTVAQTDITSGTVGGSSATVRQGPSTSAGKVTSAEAGSTVTITGEALGDDGSTWYQVDAGGQSGFIRSDLFDESAFVRGGGEESPAEGEGEGEGEAPEVSDDSNEDGEVSGEPEGGTRIVNVLSSKVIPDGVDIEDMEVDPEILAGWSSDNYYLLKTKDGEESAELYLYTPESGVKKLDTAGGGSFSSLMSGKGKFIVIGAGVVFVLLIGVCIMLAIRLRGYQEYSGYGSGAGRVRSKGRSRSYDDDEDEYEDEDDEDEYDDDEYEDEEYEDEEYDDEEYEDDDSYDDDDDRYADEDDDGYDDDEYDDEEDEEEDERPVRKRRWSPKNFLSRRDDDEEEDDEYEYDDDEDEDDDDEYLDDDDFEFEFLNMDDKDDY